VAGRGPGASSVLVGTMIEDSAHAVFLAETPEEEEGEQGTAHELDINWMAKHTRQVLRLLPDGLTILGFFLAQPDSFLVAKDGTCSWNCQLYNKTVTKSRAYGRT
jgi:hypothetical protein